ENTGASGRSRMITLSPLASVLTVIRFSKEATSWVAASVHKMKSTRMHGILRTFIKPPTAERENKFRNYAEGREVVNEQYPGDPVLSTRQVSVSSRGLSSEEPVFASSHRLTPA